MSEALAKAGHEVHVCTYHLGTQTETKGIEVQRIPRNPYRNFAPGPTYSKLLLLDPLLALKLLKVVRNNKIDIIHAHHFEGALIAYSVRKLTGVKVIYDAHTTLEGELSYYNFAHPRWLARFIEKKVPQWSDHIIAVSDELKEFFLEIGMNGKGIDVIPTGVNLEFFQTSDPKVIRDKYKLNDEKIIMYTGSLATFQGVDYLIDSAEIVLNRYRNAVLILVGNTEQEKYEKICLKKGIEDKVIFAGPRPFEEVPDFLASADVVVSPRTSCPGVPQKLINYMAARKAIVGFDGSVKLLTHNHNGVVVENGNTEAMADAIINLLESKERREALGNNALSTIFNKYDWDSLAQKTQEIYYRLM
jgi:glycosyltransferase involved in cell wall biosynthesis